MNSVPLRLNPSVRGELLVELFPSYVASGQRNLALTCRQRPTRNQNRLRCLWPLGREGTPRMATGRLSVPQVEQQPVQGRPAGPATRHRLLELEPRRRLRRLQEPRRLLLRELDPVHGEHSWY